MQDSGSGNCYPQQQWMNDWPPIFGHIENGQDRGLCMDLNRGETHNGNHIMLYGCHNGDAQKWAMDSLGRIRSKVNLNKCIEAGVDLNKELFIYDCHDGIWQQFELIEGRLRSKRNNGKYIGVSGGCDGVGQRDRLVPQTDMSGDCKWQQKWWFEGYY